MIHHIVKKSTEPCVSYLRENDNYRSTFAHVDDELGVVIVGGPGDI